MPLFSDGCCGGDRGGISTDETFSIEVEGGERSDEVDCVRDIKDGVVSNDDLQANFISRRRSLVSSTRFSSTRMIKSGVIAITTESKMKNHTEPALNRT